VVPERVASPSVPELSRRERQVAALVGAGLSNREIATELFVSERTVDSHITHIRTKLGVSSRTKLVRWAIDSGIA
jgi:DNA-binding NarL/FixJ family response regulator